MPSTIKVEIKRQSTPNAPAFELEDVDISHITPRPRRYDATA